MLGKRRVQTESLPAMALSTPRLSPPASYAGPPPYTRPWLSPGAGCPALTLSTAQGCPRVLLSPSSPRLSRQEPSHSLAGPGGPYLRWPGQEEAGASRGQEAQGHRDLTAGCGGLMWRQ